MTLKVRIAPMETTPSKTSLTKKCNKLKNTFFYKVIRNFKIFLYHAREIYLYCQPQV